MRRFVTFVLLLITALAMFSQSAFAVVNMH